MSEVKGGGCVEDQPQRVSWLKNDGKSGVLRLVFDTAAVRAQRQALPWGLFKTIHNSIGDLCENLFCCSGGL